MGNILGNNFANLIQNTLGNLTAYVTTLIPNPVVGIVGQLGYFTFIFLVFLTSFINQFGSIIYNISEGSIQPEYDFIVVGSGASGSIVASRLSENSSYKVLLLEAGVVPSYFHFIPAIPQFLQASPQDWKFQTEPQENGVADAMINNRVNFPQGKALGGTSTLNYMLCTRGNRHDFDSWEKNGATGWGYEGVLPYFLKLENNLNIGGPYHNVGGPMNIENVAFHTILADEYMNAGREMGYKELDFNGAEQIGFMKPQGNTYQGKRWSAARGYIEPARNRPNLHISLASHANKVIIDPETKQALAVDFTRGGNTFIVKAKREIILCAGALQSPKLLMLSGVGPKDQLEKFNIPVIKDLPVGKELDDHVNSAGLSFKLKQPVSFVVGRLFTNALVNFLQFFVTNNGQFTTLGTVEAIAYLRTKFAEPEFPDFPDIEFLISSASFNSDGGTLLRKIYNLKDEFYDAVYAPHNNADMVNIWVVLLHSKSTGSVTLRSADPTDPPVITTNYYKHPDDLKVVAEGIKMGLKFFETEAMKKYGAELLQPGFPQCNGMEIGSQEWCECYAKVLPTSFWHLTSTCKIGSPTDPTAVVDPRLKVYGIKGLRVADAGVMPRTPAAHTNTPSNMIGEKAADIIKEDNMYLYV